MFWSSSSSNYTYNLSISKLRGLKIPVRHICFRAQTGPGRVQARARAAEAHQKHTGSCDNLMISTLQLSTVTRNRITNIPEASVIQ